MTKIYRISKIEQAVEVATSLSGSWFRGHSRIYNELTPSVFRQSYEPFRSQEEIELSMVNAFRRAAPALTANVPGQDDHLSWLFLMQHHGTPTRLLDWSESALVSLYFAAQKDMSEDGELWAMFPDELNRHSGFFGIPTYMNKVVKYLAAEPYYDPSGLLREMNMKKIPQYPIAILPTLIFARMIAQSSTFTIHPKPQPGGTIAELLTESKHLVRYIIPAESKEKLLMSLASLGIKQRTLFPDLDGLSRSIIEDHKDVGYSPPEPPNWDYDI